MSPVKIGCRCLAVKDTFLWGRRHRRHRHCICTRSRGCRYLPQTTILQRSLPTSTCRIFPQRIESEFDIGTCRSSHPLEAVVVSSRPTTSAHDVRHRPQAPRVPKAPKSTNSTTVVLYVRSHTHTHAISAFSPPSSRAALSTAENFDPRMKKRIKNASHAHEATAAVSCTRRVVVLLVRGAALGTRGACGRCRAACANGAQRHDQ
jgi:hypothetical protein